MEVWKSVPGYEGLYEASNTGEVRSLDHYAHTEIRFNTSRLIKGRVLRPRIKPNGYYHVDLCKNGTITNFPVHRIVASAFIPNPEGLKVVNHIDGNKLNNNVSNLEWVTYQENHWHARRTGLLTQIGKCRYKPIRCVETGVVFPSHVDAGKWLASIGLTQNDSKHWHTAGNNATSSAKGRTPRAYGFHWELVSQDLAADCPPTDGVSSN